MELDLSSLLEKLISSYSSWYDFERPEGQEPLVAMGQFHEHGTGFLLIRKAEMWSADSHEYLYIFSAEHLDMALFEAGIAKARELGEPQIHPDSSHRSSYITALFLCDSAEDDALAALRKLRIRKSFQFSLKGWMEVHAAAVVLRGDIIVSNGDGRRTCEFLKNVLHPRKKDLRYRLFKK